MLEKYKYKLANATGLPWLFHYLNRKKPLILTYHGLFDGPVHKTGSLPATFVHVDNFAQQIAFIKKKYRVISPQNILDCVDGKTDLPENSALITFDDGYESFHRLAWPILKSMDISAVVFVPTRYVEDRKPFWFDMVWLFLMRCSIAEAGWLCNALGLKNTDNAITSQKHDLIFNALKLLPPEKRDAVIYPLSSDVMRKISPDDPIMRLFFSMTDEQITNLANRNIHFGGHTHSHTILSSMSYPAVVNEIAVNNEKLVKLTGSPCDFFAYPNGGAGDFDENHKEILRNSGIKVSFSLTYKRSSVFGDPMDISRINVNPEDTLESLNYHGTGMIHFLDACRRGMTFR
ncbi:MAG: polysaccharide deacetylase family protein [Desulfobacteraceae bacterium]